MLRHSAVVPLLLLGATRAIRGQDSGCNTVNYYDTQQGSGSCDALLASGLYRCDTVLTEATAEADAVLFQAACLLSCHVDFYDTGAGGIGSCHTTITGLGGTSTACALFATGQQYEGARRARRSHALARLPPHLLRGV